MSTFTAKGENFFLDDKKYTVISGAMHYFRIPRQYWQDRLLKLKECGFNTVETYMCWNLHEKKEGQFDFSDNLDIAHYITLAENLGLNVILRPGPYICAEWEMGGLPSWLLKYKNIRLRCNDELFLSKVRSYLQQVISQIKPHLLSNGGSIIMMQIENEYGSYGNDHEYMQKIADIYTDNGVDCLLYTSDGACSSMLSGGTLPQYTCVANFGSKPRENFAELEKFKPNQVKMCGEYWVGWFDHWYEEHHTRDANEVASLFKDMLDENASLNFYMFHGGTNFGFMNGANYYDKYEPTVTSYDYCALLSEAGDRTPAYYAVRDVIKDSSGSVPDLTARESKKKAYGCVELSESASLFDCLDDISHPVSSPTPLYQEDIDQQFGYTMYSTELTGPRDDWELNFDECNDRARVYLDGEYLGYFERTRHADEIRIPLKKNEKKQLDILCENMGRVNYGPRLTDNKGLSGIRFGLQYHFGWTMYPCEMDNLSKIHFEKKVQKKNIPSFYRGYFNIDSEVCDTFIRLSSFKKGFVTINNINIGRYFNEAGPQKTLYVPAPFLKKGKNEIIVFESDECSLPAVEFVDTPQL